MKKRKLTLMKLSAPPEQNNLPNVEAGAERPPNPPPTNLTWRLTMNFPIKLRHDNVIVKRIPIPSTTKGGVVLPLAAIELPQLANIIAIGPRNPEKLKPGDLVILSKFKGLLYELYGEDYYLLHINDLLAVVYHEG
jgi:chaperonin GroES